MSDQTPKTAIAKAQERQRAMREAGIPLERLSPAEKARANPGSRTLAIYAKCHDCCCGSREAIRDCASPNCALRPFRPYQ